MENPEFRSDENYESTCKEESRDSIKLESIPRDSVEPRDSRHSKCSAGHLSVQSDHSSKGFLYQSVSKDGNLCVLADCSRIPV